MPRIYTLILNTKEATPTPGVTSSYTFSNINWDSVFGGGFNRSPNVMWEVTHRMVSMTFTGIPVNVMRLSGMVRCTGFHNMSTSFFTGAINGIANGGYINTFEPLSSYNSAATDASVLVSLPSIFIIGQPTGTGSMTISLLADTSTTAVPVPFVLNAAPLHSIHTFVFTLIE